MTSKIPSLAELQSLLRPLTRVQLEALSCVSGVPFGTIYRIRNGYTPNPGIETVRKFYEHASVTLGDQHPEGRPLLDLARQPTPEKEM